MLKRTGTSLKCGTCGDWGHNKRTCKKQRNEVGEDPSEVQEPENQRTIPKCTYCQEEGHNLRTCNTRVVDLEAKKKEEADKMKEQEKSNIAHVTAADVTASSVKASHGGTIRAFKPPKKVGPLGVEVEVYQGPMGRNYTSVKNLEAAKLKRMKGKEH